MCKNLNFIYLLSIAVLFSSCGTISGRLSKVTLVDAPRGLEAKADGDGLDISSEVAISNLSVGMNADTYTNYYAQTVKLDKHKTVTLDLSSGNLNGSVEMKPRFSSAYFFGNFFFTGLTGILIDVATGNHRQHRRFIDVPAILAGKPINEWRSKSKLKRAIKRSAKK